MKIQLWFLYTVCLLISCGKNSESDDFQRVFRMNIPSSLVSLDPARAKDQTHHWMCLQLYNGLVGLDSTLTIVPGVSKSWEVSSDGRVYIFHLRDDVFFHADKCFNPLSTRKMNAKDVKFSLTRICDPKIASSGQWIFNHRVEGIELFQSGKTNNVSGFKVINDSTFEIHLQAPFPPFIYLLAMPYAGILPPEAILFYGDEFRKHPVGTGPFKLHRWEESRSLILHKNTEYFEAGLPILEVVKFSFHENPIAAFQELLQGKVDMLNRPDYRLKDEVLTSEGTLKPAWISGEFFKLISVPQLNTEYLAICSQLEDKGDIHTILKDLRIRKAIQHAIDRKALVRLVLNGQGTPATAGIIPPGLKAFDSTAVKGYNYSPQKSAQLLAEAGYPEGKGLPEITLYSNPSYQALSEFIQYQLSTVGFKIKIEQTEAGSMRDMAARGLLPFWRASWIADYPDGENYLSLGYEPFTAPSGPNTTRMKDLVFNQLYERALLTKDEKDRNRLYQQADSVLMERSWIIPLYYDRVIRLVRPEVLNLPADPMNQLVLKYVQKLPLGSTYNSH
jgi:peptide/nickel transport system substrate-binding protein